MKLYTSYDFGARIPPKSTWSCKQKKWGRDFEKAIAAEIIIEYPLSTRPYSLAMLLGQSLQWLDILPFSLYTYSRRYQTSIWYLLKSYGSCAPLGKKNKNLQGFVGLATGVL